MKRICKQCGKEFTLTSSELNFYRSKNLAFPKRCPDCRAENKAQAEPESNIQVKQESNIQVKQPVENPKIIEEEPVSQARPEVYKPQREKPEIGKKWWVAVAVVLIIAIISMVPNFTKKSGNAGTFETKGYAESTDGNIINSSENVDESTTSSDKQNVAVNVRFRNNTLLQQHYDKHGKSMGFSSAVEYEIAAAKVVSNPKALHKTEAEDGDDVYYLKETNEFVVVSTDGYIRTYFKPSDGINYYNRQ